MQTYKKYAIRIVNNWSLITNYEGSHICSLYWYNSDTQERYFTTWDLPDGWAILEPNNKDNKYINVFSKEESENKGRKVGGKRKKKNKRKKKKKFKKTKQKKTHKKEKNQINISINYI